MRLNQSSAKLAGRFLAFTLVEMLIAMAVTLLMMAALAKSFGFIGQRVRDGRAIVHLSSELRDITTRLHDELSQCTVSLEPASVDYEPPGYFLYSEGPMTDASSTIFGSAVTIDGQSYLPDSRYGDIDDYLAFTAVAKPGQWFTGKVPTSVLSGKAASLNPLNSDGDSTNNVAPSTSTTLQVVKSKYAEIVYFCAPDRNPPSGTATIGPVIDADGNGLPDRLSLYRRVLLIRPDLVIDADGLDSGTDLQTLRNADGQLFGFSSGTNWLLGMTTAHGSCDLSIRRGLNTNGVSTTAIIPNSLEDLSKPHNRFGHVRIPGASIGATGTSMPVLALTPPVAVISNASGTGTYPSRPGPTSTATGNGPPVAFESRWGGYLHPSFLLSGTRLGEDVVANNCRGLDIQVFDPEAEYLVSNSTNLVIKPSDPGYREALRQPVGSTSTVVTGGYVDLCYPLLAGGPLRGWQSMRVSADAANSNFGNDAFDDATNTPEVDIDDLNSPFSGINPALTGTTSYPSIANPLVFDPALLKSGRVLVRNGTANRRITLFQPAFDTFTNTYERDGFRQDNRTPGSVSFGTSWTTSSSNIDQGANGLDDNATSSVGIDDTTEFETSPPFTTTPSAIRVSVRLESLGNRQIRQQSVTYRGGK